MTVITKNGKLEVNLLDPEGKKVRDIRKGESIENAHIVKKEGDYTIQIRAKEHKGSFILKWEIYE